jgi:hypothetical protein
MSELEFVLIETRGFTLQETVFEMVISGARGPAGPGLPAGGNVDQMIKKSSLVDYATEWFTLTKDFIGLGNVTDDAQLKRSAGDFSTFTEKASPVSADLLLIEDSEAAGVKKKVQIGNLPSSGGGGSAFTLERIRNGEIPTGPFASFAISDELSGTDLKEVRIKSKALPTGQDIEIQVYRKAAADNTPISITDSVFTGDVPIDIDTSETLTAGEYQAGCNTSGATVGTPGTTLDSNRVANTADDILHVYVTQAGSTLTGADLTVGLSMA